MLAMVSGQVFRLVKKEKRLNSSNSSLSQPSAQFLLRFSRAYLYYAYGAHVPFCTGDTAYTLYTRDFGGGVQYLEFKLPPASRVICR